MSGKQALGRAIGLLVVLATLAEAAVVYRRVMRHPRTDDAFLRANFIGIAPHVSGPIVELPIADNQRVRQGDLLFAIDPRPYEHALALATAELELTSLEVRGFERAIETAEARVKQREADAAYARQYLARVEPLLRGDFATRNQVEEARTKVRASEAGLAEAKAEVARARDLLGKLGDVNTRRKAAEARVAAARLNVDYCRVVAPFDAWVTNLNIAVGQYANEGREIFALIDDREWYVMANYRESFLRHIAPGMPAEVFLMGYPGKRLRGTVQGVGWGLHQRNGATVGVLPEVEPTLNWLRLAQRFPVRIRLEDRDPDVTLRMGASAVVTVQGDD